MAKTMAFAYVDGVLLAVHPAANPSEPEWEAYIRFCEQLPKTCRRTLAVTAGGGPNAVQRKLLQERYLRAFVNDKMNPMKVAVVTNSSIVRGIVTALNWFNPNTSAFPADAIHEALRYLGVSDPAALARISLETRKLQREVAS